MCIYLYWVEVQKKKQSKASEQSNWFASLASQKQQHSQCEGTQRTKKQPTELRMRPTKTKKDKDRKIIVHKDSIVCMYMDRIDTYGKISTTRWSAA